MTSLSETPHVIMPNDISRGDEHLPPNSDESNSASDTRKWYKNEEWVYGFNLKNRYLARVAKKFDLPWETHPGAVLHAVELVIRATSCVHFKARYLYHRGRPTLIFFFAEDDGRKRLKRSTIAKEDMDEVRKAMYLPRGMKPRWYDCHGRNVETDDAVSSGDDDWPTADERGADESDSDSEDECDCLNEMDDEGAELGSHSNVKS